MSSTAFLMMASLFALIMIISITTVLYVSALFKKEIAECIAKHMESPEMIKLYEDAELGRAAMRFIDRAGDYCKEDPAERICDEFHNAMADIVDRQCAKKGMPSNRYDTNGSLKCSSWRPLGNIKQEAASQLT